MIYSKAWFTIRRTSREFSWNTVALHVNKKLTFLQVDSNHYPRRFLISPTILLTIFILPQKKSKESFKKWVLLHCVLIHNTICTLTEQYLSSSAEEIEFKN